MYICLADEYKNNFNCGKVNVCSVEDAVNSYSGAQCLLGKPLT